MRGRAYAGDPRLPFTGSTPLTRAQSQAAPPTKHRAEQDRARVLEYIRQEADGGATDDEIQTALDMEGNTERPRRIELARAGCIEHRDTITRRTRSGRPAVVWFFRKDLTL